MGENHAAPLHFCFLKSISGHGTGEKVKGRRKGWKASKYGRNGEKVKGRRKGWKAGKYGRNGEKVKGRKNGW